MRLACEPLESRFVPSRTGLADFASLAVDPHGHDPHTILVRSRDGGPAVQPVAGTTLETAIDLVPGLHTVRLSSGMSVASALVAYRAHPLVLYAEPNYFVGVQDADPDDPQYSQQCSLPVIQAPAAWDIHTGSYNTTVAVIDTGIAYNHPDLANNIWINPGEIPLDRLVNLTDLDGDGRITFIELNDPVNQGPGLITDQNGDKRITAADILVASKGELGGWADGTDDDGNGQTDDLVGWNFVANSRTTLDDNGHGTAVAGIVGAEGNNGIGITGIAWRTQLMPVKFLNAQGSGTIANALRSLEYAVYNGARVSSNGWGGAGYSQAFFDALTAARDVGHVFVTDAGASGIDIDQRPQYPASYAVENVVVSDATDCQDQYARFSNYGVNTVDLSAPGVSVRTTSRNDSYVTLSGGSFAQAHVAGALVLLWDYLPDLAWNEVIDQVLVTVDPLDPPCRTITCGRLNVGRALGGSQPGGGSAPGFDGSILPTLLKRRMEEHDAFLFTIP